MNYVGQLAEQVFVTVKELYKGLNPATLTGCIDVIVVRQPDGSYQCSPFHVRFGKLGVLRSKEKVVDIEINGEPVELQMKLGDTGEAFFVEITEEDEGTVPTHLATSPIPIEEQTYYIKETDLLGASAESVENQNLPSPFNIPEIENSTVTTSTKKKRRRRRKYKQGSAKKEDQESSSDEQDVPELDISSEEVRYVATSTEMYHLYSELRSEHSSTFHSRAIYPYSDGEWSSGESHSYNRPPSPKSDSELVVKLHDGPFAGTEPRMQWSWGGFPQVSKMGRSEQPRTATITPCEHTHFRVIKDDDAIESVALNSSAVNNIITVLRPQPQPLTQTSLTSLEKSMEKETAAVTEPDFPEATPWQLPEAEVKEDAVTDISLQTLQLQTTENGSSEQPTDEVFKPIVQPDPESNKQIDPGTSESSISTAQQMSPEETSGKTEDKDKKKGGSKRSQHLGPCDIYLDDLQKLDPNVAALYFPKSEQDSVSKQLNEPGTHSESQSPQSVGSAAVDSGTEYLSDSACDLPDVNLSLCGGLSDNNEISQGKFLQHRIKYQELVENPGLIDDPNLVIGINKKYYNWAVAAPMILCMQAFQKNLPKATIDKLVKEKMPKKTGRWWFSWRRKNSTTTEPDAKNKIDEEQNETNEIKQSTSLESSRPKDEFTSSDDDFGNMKERPKPGSKYQDSPGQCTTITFKKSLRLSSEKLKSLNLKDGPNNAVFSVTTQYQGTCRCEGTIYLWNWDDKVIISDIDGTITKSDALGHILPQLGKDWTHQGIAKLYHKIHQNGYKFLYCSARAIGMADITRGYLHWVNDRGTVLPKGPLLLAPNSLISALHREVIEKKPELFKIECLNDIKNLFNPHRRPFYAAFGNRTNDAYAYKEVGVQQSRIFTVNPKGELIQEQTKSNKSSYPRLGELVEHVFPLITQERSSAFLYPEFSHFAFWRETLPELNLDEINEFKITKE
ncbi:phosphatidate phosphatase LPIN2 isoform X1 [Callorhinchus milii]|uniref:phosphatidate phosphatase LPIN2 isoform X1 n=1 Tax=Callorhinchus milii TaxID=7868 RepID=UPI001C3FA2CF|nr:phosphatidate phosphatase LPIN2 isoform X1 [Callorhinchus milii]XP_007882945.2 phosphatidate phosphatase LPIN2 isoform X1 [Callorhinchus milii]